MTVHEPMAEVEGALIDHLQKHVLSEGVLQLVLREIRSEIEAQLQREADVAALEAELATARTEQKRLASAAIRDPGWPTTFPDGLTFTPDRSPDAERQVWRISGSANLGSLVDQSGPE